MRIDSITVSFHIRPPSRKPVATKKVAGSRSLESSGAAIVTLSAYPSSNVMQAALIGRVPSDRRRVASVVLGRRRAHDAHTLVGVAHRHGLGGDVGLNRRLQAQGEPWVGDEVREPVARHAFDAGQAGVRRAAHEDLATDDGGPYLGRPRRSGARARGDDVDGAITEERGQHPLAIVGLVVGSPRLVHGAQPVTDARVAANGRSPTSNKTTTSTSTATAGNAASTAVVIVRRRRTQQAG